MRCGLPIQVAKHVELQAPLPQKPNFLIKHPLVVLSCAHEGMKQKGGPVIREATTVLATRLFAPYGNILSRLENIIAISTSLCTQSTGCREQQWMFRVGSYLENRINWGP